MLAIKATISSIRQNSYRRGRVFGGAAAGLGRLGRVADGCTSVAISALALPPGPSEFLLLVGDIGCAAALALSIDFVGWREDGTVVLKIVDDNEASGCAVEGVLELSPTSAPGCGPVIGGGPRFASSAREGGTLGAPVR
jgi:hypothetical protein